jgi:hypothetical protein
MFRLPQVAQGDNSNEMRDGLPVVEVTEEKKTLEILLSMSYPMAAANPPVVDALEEAVSLLEAAIKYDFVKAEKKAREWLIAPQILEEDPVRVYMIACRYRLKDEAMVAARSTLGWPIFDRPDEPELEHVTGAQLCRLFRYNQACQAAMKRVIEDMSPQFPCCRVCSHEWCHEFPEVGFGEVEVITSTSFDLSRFIDGVTEGLWREQTQNMDLIEKVYQDALIMMVTETLWIDKTNSSRIETSMPICLKCRPLFSAKLQEYRDTLVTRVDEALSQVRDFR